MENRPRSQVIQRRLSFSATAEVAPDPQKQSMTRSPSFDADLKTRSRKASDFCVAYPTPSADQETTYGISTSSHILWAGLPVISSRYRLIRGIPFSVKKMRPSATYLSILS